MRAVLIVLGGIASVAAKIRTNDIHFKNHVTEIYWDEIAESNHPKEMTITSSGNTITVKATRNGDREPAEFFLNGLISDMWVGAKKGENRRGPEKLNFAIKGDLSMRVSWPGNELGYLKLRCPDMRLGQGYVAKGPWPSYNNNWWLGAPGCMFNVYTESFTLFNRRPSVVCACVSCFPNPTADRCYNPVDLGSDAKEFVKVRFTPDTANEYTVTLEQEGEK